MGERRGTRGLELWCRRLTEGYPGVKVENMTTSWRDGLAFCAIIHHFRPDLLDFSKLNKNDIFHNNDLAFRVAERHLGIPALLEPEDMVQYTVPDRLSILTYLSQYYQTFGHMTDGGRKLTKRPQTAPELNIVSETDASPAKKAAIPRGASVIRREPCANCGLPVFIAERLNVGKFLYHRTCFRCARCNSQLSLANYYETEMNEFCCETCPDEEKLSTETKESAKSILSKSLSDEEKSASMKKSAADTEDPYSSNFETALEFPADGSLKRNYTIDAEFSSKYSDAKSRFIDSIMNDDDSSDESSDSEIEDEPPDRIREEKSEHFEISKAQASENTDSSIDLQSLPSAKDNSDVSINLVRSHANVYKNVDLAFSEISSNDNNTFDRSHIIGSDRPIMDTEDIFVTKDNPSLVKPEFFVTSDKTDHETDSHVTKSTYDKVPYSIETPQVKKDDNVDASKIDKTDKFSKDLDTRTTLKEDVSTRNVEGEKTSNEEEIEDVEIGKTEHFSVLSDKIEAETLELQDTPESSITKGASVQIPQVAKRRNVNASRIDHSGESSNVSNTRTPLKREALIRNFERDKNLNEEIENVQIVKSDDSRLVSDKTGSERHDLQDTSKSAIDKADDTVQIPQVAKRRNVKANKINNSDELGIVLDTRTSLTKKVEGENILNKEEIEEVQILAKDTESNKKQYPVVLNPFGSDQEDEDIENENVKTDGGDKKESSNPFGDDDDDDNDTADRKNEDFQTPEAFQRRLIMPSTADRRLSTPGSVVRTKKVIKVSLNPFSSDESEEEEEQENQSDVSSMPVAKPSPKPRTKKKPSSPNLSLSSRKIGGTGTADSSPSSSNPGTARRKKAPAPRPPIINVDIESSSSFISNPSDSLQHTSKSAAKKKAPPPPTVSTPFTQNNTLYTLEYLGISPIDFSKQAPSDEDSMRKAEEDLEKQKIAKDEINRNKQSQKSPTSSENLNILAIPNKSAYGKWKRKKGQAPSRPIPQKRSIRSLPIEQVRHELDLIEIQQQGLEKQGVKLEQIIRERCEGPDANPEDSQSAEVEDLILQLFELVNEKNELFRKQAELMYLRRQQRLEEEHADTEYQIRCIMLQPEANKTDSDKAKEEELINRLVEIVERRNEIVQCLEMDRVREIEEDDSINVQMNLFTLKRGVEMKDLKKSRKKEKKKHKKEKKSKHKKVDSDKDVDESESQPPQPMKEKKKKKFKLFQKVS